MKRFRVSLLALLIIILLRCGVEQNKSIESSAVSQEIIYSSDTSAEDCYLCGTDIDNAVSSYWGQNNAALISLNTFEIKPIEINRYDRFSGQMIDEYAGVVSFGAVSSKDGGFSASLMLDYDRGYATGSVVFSNDEVLDTSKAANFLCEDCLNEILPRQVEQCFGVGVINFATKEVQIFEEGLKGFALGDFYIDCDLQDQGSDKHQMDILIFYCPIRYEEEP